MKELKLNDIVTINMIDVSGCVKGIWHTRISDSASSTQYQVRYVNAMKQIVDEWFLREELTKGK